MISKATHYGGFESYGQKPFPTLKPGQDDLTRDYYPKVSSLEDELSFAQGGQRQKTIYQANHSLSVEPSDYVSRPREPCFDSKREVGTGKSRVLAADATAEEKKDSKTLTSHWKTDYQRNFAEAKGPNR